MPLVPLAEAASEIGRELDAPEIQRQSPRERFHQLGLAQPRHAFEQHITARDDRREHALDHALLPHDDAADRRAQVLEIVAKALGFGLKLGGIAHAASKARRARRVEHMSLR